MKHLKSVNRKAAMVEQDLEPKGNPQEGDVVALQQGPPQQPQQSPHFPLGCSLQFDPGWEVDSSGGTAGLCQPVEPPGSIVTLRMYGSPGRKLSTGSTFSVSEPERPGTPDCESEPLGDEVVAAC